MGPDETIIENDAWAGAEPRLSVLIPFFQYDPTALIERLDAGGAAVEIIALDDGSGDPALAGRVARAVRALATPARLVLLERNVGRAAGRNRLAAEARGRWLLFLDADMLPDAPDFLRRWLEVVEAHAPAVAFGGFSVTQAPVRRVHSVHRAMALRSECLSAAQRRRAPAKYVFSSNLLIRRDVFDAEPFDPAFVGWGWEDVEWGLRVSRRWPILHVDNPATHLGLGSAREMAAKFEQSAANFARVVRAHGDIARAWPSYRAARLIQRLPLRRGWRPWLKELALAERLPAKLRAFALRLYRASLYAEQV